jgi:hypothetical protein
MAVLNDPAVQKLGKQAVKMAVSYIPVVGPGAAQILGMLGFGKAGNTRAAIVKQIMQEKGLSLTEASKYVKAHNLYTPRSKLKGGADEEPKADTESKHKKEMREHREHFMKNMANAMRRDEEIPRDPIPRDPRLTGRDTASQAARFTEVLRRHLPSEKAKGKQKVTFK